jgi:hypothetical protein
MQIEMACAARAERKLDEKRKLEVNVIELDEKMEEITTLAAVHHTTRQVAQLLTDSTLAVADKYCQVSATVGDTLQALDFIYTDSPAHDWDFLRFTGLRSLRNMMETLDSRGNLEPRSMPVLRQLRAIEIPEPEGLL